ncbi:D-alanyl-D-alanine carboxypeptidase family protein [Virgibacillus siamensis]|uniref:D-alanyl-D-alanine carboxypeptidase family protein n=1 Tax=Virgibacillus siamensis TaxID=480071 RepID=UPI000985B5FD|nr:D-alanyl-D-alanine carboxypeptidase family protein [Virgibacillus siamensis]
MRHIFIAISLIISLIVFPAIGQAKPSVSANNAVLMEQSSGRVLFAKAAHEKQPIASITKIMTAIIAIESGMMNETVTVSKKSVYTEGSSIYLEQGEKIKLKDLVYGLMLRSGNDAAVAISEHVGGSVEGFVHMMNKKAKWIGMTNTSFANPHGLDADNHYSTAYDMALLMRYAMKNKQFRKITGTTSFQSENRSYSWMNKNKLLTKLYKYCTGGKTGYTQVAGRTLVSTAKKNKMDLIAVTLNGPDDWQDHISLFEWGFDKFDMKTIGNKGKVEYNLDDASESTIGYLHHDITYPLNYNELQSLESKSFILKDATDVSTDIIGKTIYFIDSVPVLETPIYAEKKRETSFLSSLNKVYKQLMGLY